MVQNPTQHSELQHDLWYRVSLPVLHNSLGPLGETAGIL